jgi:hypothetical protein
VNVFTSRVSENNQADYREKYDGLPGFFPTDIIIEEFVLYIRPWSGLDEWVSTDLSYLSYSLYCQCSNRSTRYLLGWHLLVNRGGSPCPVPTIGKDVRCLPPYLRSAQLMYLCLTELAT